jgi:hypothetical protein
MKTNATYTIALGQRSIDLHLPEPAREFQCAAAATKRSIRDWVHDVVTHPLEFPDLSLAILDDDHVAVAVEAGVPKSVELASEMVAWLHSKKLRPEQIAVVLSATESDSLSALQSALAPYEGLRILQHTPKDPEHLVYVAAAETADAIYIQRDLVDASVVIPIYCIRHPEALNASDPYAMSPAFADAKTQQRWNLAWLEDNAQHLHVQSKLSREAGWLMGIQFAIAVIPAENGEIAGLLGGDPGCVFQAATARLQAASNEQELSDANELVIACVEGGREQQTWMNVARAVVKADSLLTPAGCLVVCCDLHRISDGIAQLASDEPDEVLERELLRGDLEDAFPAAVIRSVQARRSIYLMAPLEESQVEGLGLAYVSGQEDIERLAHRARSICLLRTSQF